ncbi:hypothetical protein EDC94DRAFT_494066, partial [Helicostylum pulchrum]
SKLIGFKIDLRFILDFEDQEFDLCELECALPDADTDKKCDDFGKLIREGKTNTISLHDITDNFPIIHTWIIQACGLQLDVSTVVYIDNDLFVVVPQFSIEYPTEISHLEFFIDSIKNLFTFREDIESLARSSLLTLRRARDGRNKQTFRLS